MRAERRGLLAAFAARRPPESALAAKQQVWYIFERFGR
jgi:hypothetical protein